MNAVQVDSISKTYLRRGLEPLHAVDRLSFEVPPGQIFGLLGPNGAGKSTMVKILTTMTAPTSGRAAVSGFDVVRQPLEMRKRIAVVLQQTAVETLLSVADNLRIYGYLHGMSRKDVDARLNAILEEFDLQERSRDMVQDLSLGTRRRVQVAKIFMLDTPVIFLDECTTGMDPFMRRRVLTRIRREARNGRTVLLTTQMLSEAEELCDTIMILDHGKALALGSLAELRRLSADMFRVTLGFLDATGFHTHLERLNPAQLRIEGNEAELLFKGQESLLLQQLAELSQVAPIQHFEVRGAGLEDIFVEIVGERGSPSSGETGP